ncbi:hypothetical protein HGO38_25420 [Rhizobium sp. CG5]|uniref:hypothetical protein n=1 Tax=Rhizobium sp. CG5 TaxID=2726076 RepID=UPI0020333F25|nr:hypothetical protein [Rhizobium sp. CG5]MCM2476791.1 hypothetical protein [Rhizobium sp. CG5]
MNNWLAERWFRVIAKFRDKAADADFAEELLSQKSLAKVKIMRLIFATIWGDRNRRHPGYLAHQLFQ